MVHSVFEAHPRKQSPGTLADRRVVALCDHGRQGHVLLGGQRGEQVEELEDEPDVVAPELGELLVLQTFEWTPPTAIAPEVGDSSAPTIWSSVLLPDPDGPMIATISPSSIVKSTPSRARTSVRPSP